MGVTQPTTLNDDTDAIRTAAEYADRGDGTSKWFMWLRAANGGITALGATTDAAVTNPATNGTLINFIRGLLTQVNTLVTTLTSAGASNLMKAEDAAAASGDTGVMALAVRRDTPTADGAAGDYVPLHVDSTGRLRTVLAAPSNATTTALAASLVVKASAGRLYGLSGYTTVAQFIQVYDAASLPSDGGTPAVTFPVEASKPFSIDFGPTGRAFTTGIVVGNSTTGPTKTIGAADTWFDAQYE